MQRKTKGIRKGTQRYLKLDYWDCCDNGFGNLLTYLLAGKFGDMVIFKKPYLCSLTLVAMNTEQNKNLIIYN